MAGSNEMPVNSFFSPLLSKFLKNVWAIFRKVGKPEECYKKFENTIKHISETIAYKVSKSKLSEKIFEITE